MTSSHDSQDRPPLGAHQPAVPHPLGPPPEPAAPPDRPGAVRAAFWLAVLVPVLVTVLYAVNSLLTRHFLAEVAAGPVAGIALVTSLLVLPAMLVLTALWIAFGFQLRAGRGWARIVLTVFAGIWAFYSVGGLVTGSSALTGIGPVPVPAGIVAAGFAQSAVGLAAMLAFLVLVHLPASNRYFQAAGAAR
ncbi:hypothetical protein ABZ805_00460 [Saccharopolyspora sp. NPDC047091]|uniref:hypothetical protein n=1 Tax=Saccharopolyspora sp. NPDC047091 TaxID=3155924 RepID=UPI0033C3DF37